MRVPCVWQGLGRKKLDRVGKTQKQSLGCLQGDEELLGDMEMGSCWGTRR